MYFSSFNILVSVCHSVALSFSTSVSFKIRNPGSLDLNEVNLLTSSGLSICDPVMAL